MCGPPCRAACGPPRTGDAGAGPRRFAVLRGTRSGLPASFSSTRLTAPLVMGMKATVLSVNLKRGCALEGRRLVENLGAGRGVAGCLRLPHLERRGRGEAPTSSFVPLVLKQ